MESITNSCSDMLLWKSVPVILQFVELWMNLFTIWILLLLGFWVQEKMHKVVPLSPVSHFLSSPRSSPIEVCHSLLFAFSPLLYFLSVYKVTGLYWNDGFIDLSLLLVASFLLYLLFTAVLHHRMDNKNNDDDESTK